MATTQQQLAQKIAERQATAMSIDKVRSYIQNFATSRISEIERSLRQQTGTSAWRAGAMSEIKRFTEIANEAKQGKLPSFSKLAPTATNGAYMAPVVFDRSVGFAPTTPDGRELNPRDFRDTKSYQDAVLAQSKGFYDSLVAKAGTLSALDQQITTLSTQAQFEQAPTRPTSGTNTQPGDPGQPVDPNQQLPQDGDPRIPSDSQDQSSPNQLPQDGEVRQTLDGISTRANSQSNDRSRVRRDRSRIAFGTPRFGVGINIPLGT